MSKPFVKILVCCHKPGEWLSDDVYMPIQCGKAISQYNLGIQGDDMGEYNISTKNPHYCELTALYWAWKNLKDVDYIGLCHYRRYFCSLKLLPSSRIEVYPTLNSARKYVLDKKNVLDGLTKSDIILPKKNYCPYNLRTEYAYMLNSIEYKLLKETVQKLYPDYIDAFEQVMYYGNSYSAYNMFVCRRSLFDNYAKWLFTILFEVEKHLFIDHYYGHYSRVFGYMSERLLNVYIMKHQLRIMHVSVAMISETYKTGLLKETGKRFFAQASFLLNKPRKPEEFF